MQKWGNLAHRKLMIVNMRKYHLQHPGGHNVRFLRGLPLKKKNMSEHVGTHCMEGTTPCTLQKNLSKYVGTLAQGTIG